MRKLTAVILVLSIIMCLCACGKKDDDSDARECGVYVTVEADDIYSVSCGTEAGSESAAPAEGGKIEAGTEYHFDFSGDEADVKKAAVIPYMICIYDKDFNILSDASFEDDFSGMARIDIVVTKDHNIIYKGGKVDCGGKLSVTMTQVNPSEGVYATDAKVCVSDNEEASEKINTALADYYNGFLSNTEANLASYTENTAQFKGQEVPAFSMSQIISISRGDSHVASFKVRDYVYLGTQELIVLTAHNYDVNTGNELSLSDVFSDIDALKKCCTEHILVSTADDNAIYNEGYTSAIPQLVDDGNWYLNNEGLVIIANKGVISDSSCEFTITYEDIKEYINDDFLPVETGDPAPGSISAVYGNDASVNDLTFIGAKDAAPENDDVVIAAKGSISNINVYSVKYNEESGNYDPVRQLFYCSDLRNGGSFTIDTALESAANVLVKFTTTYGSVTSNLLSVDENGSIRIVDPNGGDLGIDISKELPYKLDINGDSNDDEIDLKGSTITVTSSGESVSYKTEIEQISSIILHDSNYDGNFEIFVVGDMCSDDYIIYCLKYDGSLNTIPFDGADYCSGGISSFSADTVTVNTRADILGTYSYYKNYKYTDGEFKSVDQSSYKISSEVYIVPIADIATVDGGVVATGTEVKLIATDLKSFVTLQAKDGTIANIAVAPNDGDWGWLINGVPESNLFESLPYAG